jgi:small subunit ribosomal protein S20
LQEINVANHPQAEKRNRQRIKRQAHHRHFRTYMRTLIKAVNTAVTEKDGGKAAEMLKSAVPMIDRCAQKNVIPRKRASRIIARLTKRVTTI